MQRQSNLSIFGFAIVVCLFASVIVAVSSTALKPKQKTEARLDVVRNILSVAGFDDEKIQTMRPDEMLAIFRNEFAPLFLNKENASVGREEIEERLSTLGYGHDFLHEMYPFELVQTFNAKLSLLARRAHQKKKDYDPGYKLLFLLKKDGKIDKYIVPIEGYGLWGMMYGYIALQHDLNTVAGIRFYKHQETPGLGGECEKPWFTSQFVDKKILNADGELVSVTIVKGKSADLYSGEELTHHVDGISGATITGKSINAYLSDDLAKFEPYFKTIRNGAPLQQGDPTDAGETK